MRSPVQSRVPLLDKNKAFERLPLLGAFFFYTSIGAGLHYGLRLSLKPWGIALKFLFLHHENILFPND
ncbi:hypothetical protein DW027_22420 [Bacteroides xylanisolvens]|uniref:Uncharacterized protein n=1 Tax=Bacteroides xylanisolvens TaxID=371601 RepID=A0A415KAU3_9BACE|nr:hypothetical protein DW027_22420 [Bacteroides xylanisolvens]